MVKESARFHFHESKPISRGEVEENGLLYGNYIRLQTTIDDSSSDVYFPDESHRFSFLSAGQFQVFQTYIDGSPKQINLKCMILIPSQSHLPNPQF